MSSIGVVGAGVMGSGVADQAARRGPMVSLVDVDEGALHRAVTDIRRSWRFSRLNGGEALDPAALGERLSVSTDLAVLRDCDIVVENVTEKWAVKQPVYERLDQECGPSTIFIVNTSAIPIARVAGVTGRPDRVVGVHFMNPVTMKGAVELIPSAVTSADALERVKEFLDSLDKVGILVGDVCGFVSNRILMLTVNEAALTVTQGVASAETVDRVFCECFGHPMGPLETADLIGVDTITYTLEVLHDHYGDGKFAPAPLLEEMTRDGRHGRKTGRGFYSYTGPAPVDAARRPEFRDLVPVR